MNGISYSKMGLMILLVFNALVFLSLGEYNDAFDSLAWIVLMVLYQIETDQLSAPSRLRGALPCIRNLSVGIVVIAETSYLFEGAWLDGVYSVLWLLVVVLFEIESRYQSQVIATPRLFQAASIALVAGMAGVIGAWILEGSYFNAYDGLIWSLAFVIIDLNLIASAYKAKAQGLGNASAPISSHR